MESKLYSLEGVFTLQPPDRNTQELYTVTKIEPPSNEDAWQYYSYMNRMPPLVSQAKVINDNNNNIHNDHLLASPMLEEE